MRPVLVLAGVLVVVAAGGCAGTATGQIVAPGATVVAGAAAGLATPAARSVAAVLQQTLGAGYEGRDAARVLKLYTADALVRTKLYGEIGMARFKEVLEGDFSKLGADVKAQITLRQFALADGVGTATVGFAVTGTLRDGRPVSRTETWYFRMREAQGAWLAFQQSYRADFSAPAGSAHPTVPTDELRAIPVHGSP